jgi:hypothetical protein
MPTYSECLLATKLAIQQSTELMRKYHGHEAQIQDQIDLTRKLIEQTLATLKTLSRITGQ